MAYRPDQQREEFIARLNAQCAAILQQKSTVDKLIADWTAREYGTGAAFEITDVILTNLGYEGLTQTLLNNLMANIVSLQTAINNCGTNISNWTK